MPKEWTITSLKYAIATKSILYMFRYVSFEYASVTQSILYVSRYVKITQKQNLTRQESISLEDN